MAISNQQGKNGAVAKVGRNGSTDAIPRFWRYRNTRYQMQNMQSSPARCFKKELRALSSDQDGELSPLAEIRRGKEEPNLAPHTRDCIRATIKCKPKVIEPHDHLRCDFSASPQVSPRIWHTGAAYQRRPNH